MFEILQKINQRPGVFEYYTADELWTDDHTSGQMLAYHLNENLDMASRNSAFIQRSVAWIVSEFKVGADTRIIDFGCGPGWYTTGLARHGAKVTGVDFSPRSIEYARATAVREQLEISYIHRNYLDFSTEERFDLVLMIMCDLCALSPAQRALILAKFHTLLKPGGSVLLDVYSLSAFDQREEAAFYERNQLDGFWSPAPYYGFVNTFKYEDEKVMLDKYTIVEAGRTRTVYNWLQYFAPATLEKEFKKAGFAIDGRYADVAGTAYDPDAAEFAVVARKS